MICNGAACCFHICCVAAHPPTPYHTTCHSTHHTHLPLALAARFSRTAALVAQPTAHPTPPAAAAMAGAGNTSTSTSSWRLDFGSVEHTVRPSSKLDPPGYDAAVARDWVRVCAATCTQLQPTQPQRV
jgi:hypothetical protein